MPSSRALAPNAPCRRAGQCGKGETISFRISILASGSSGNATLLETENTFLLIDAGLGRKEVLRRLEAVGRPLDRLDAILVTHEHTDHSSGIPQLLRQWQAAAYMTEATHRAILQILAADSAKRIDRVDYIHPGQKFLVGDIEVTPFAIPHDAADPVAYTFCANGSKVAIVTDLGYMPELVKHHLRGADCLLLESNHDLDMLKVGPYPWYVKQRVMSRTGHLSNDTVADYLSDPSGFDGLARYLVLGHLSETNNNPELARISAEQALSCRPPESAFRGELLIASQRSPLGPFLL